MENTWTINELKELYYNNQYSQLIEKIYPVIQKHGIRKGNYWSFDWYSCKLLCSALFLCGYYYDCLLMMKLLFADISFESEILTAYERAHFVECALESLLYSVFNESSLVIDPNRKIELLLEKAMIYFESDSEYDDCKFISIKNLYEKYKNGKPPYYTVSFFVPLVLNFEHYTFDLTGAYPYRSMEIKRKKHGTVNGTVFSVTIEGFIKADSFWEGPTWSNRQKLASTTLALNLVNRLLLIISEGDIQDFIPRIRHEQLSNVVLHQYAGDGCLYHWCDGTMFDGQFIRKWLQRPEYTHEELEKINHLLISNYNLPLYASLYHQAQNIMHAGLYEESIMLFFVCMEATVHYWCEFISRLSGIDADYKEFISRKHICINCSLYLKEPNGKGVSTAKLPPSIRSYPNFLRKHKIINRDQEKLLRKLIIESQNDELRNKMMHGQTVSVTFTQVENCRKTIYRLNKQFIAIADKYSLQQSIG